jgi:uncharacterized protein YcaQ
LPAHVDARIPTLEEFAAHLVDQQLRCHALVSLKGLTYLRRNAGLRQAVKTLVQERLAEGLLQQVGVSSGEVFLVNAGALDVRLPRVPDRLQILSPFDNSVIQRERLQTLFDFDYQIECYVPAAKRQFGYFCLPLLYRDAFIGRMDCKAHRKTRELEIRSLHIESPTVDERTVTTAFADAVQKFCAFQQCDSVLLTRIYPPHLAPQLRLALEQLDMIAGDV